MGKVNKKKPLKHSNHHDNPQRAKKAVIRRQHSQNVSKNEKSKVTSKPEQVKSKSTTVNGPSSSKVKVSFSKWDQVLLIGEGDFSFTLSLAQNYKVGSIVATCFDSKDVLEQKYPNVVKTIKKVTSSDDGPRRLGEDSQSTLGQLEEKEEAWRGFSPSTPSDESEEDTDNKETAKDCPKASIFHSIDATKLSTTHKKMLKSHAPFTKIIFNFPHVGGLSTDVNRQVRANQQLLVEFFNSAKPLLACKANPAKSLPADNLDYLDENFDDDVSDPGAEEREYAQNGQILVTLFEGEPYTLWNIRDLARHSGLKVLESFKFPWSAYPGYQHARTIGDITVGKDRSNDGKRKGAWRGEERDARCYILALKDDNTYPAPGSRKRKKNQDNDD